MGFFDGHFSKSKRNRKLINKGSDNKYFYEKCIILEDMPIEAEDIICNEYYVRMFYPLDTQLRKNGKLTLIQPSYCKLFLALSKNITSILSNRREFLNEVIPNKDEIILQIKNIMTSNDNMTVMDIVTLMKERNPLIKLKQDSIHDLVYELINRVLNALVGDRVKQFRKDVLFRVNTVAFRTDIAVKSEKKK